MSGIEKAGRSTGGKAFPARGSSSKTVRSGRWSEGYLREQWRSQYVHAFPYHPYIMRAIMT